MKWNECIQILKECEQKLQGLGAAAMREGDYAGLRRVTDVAQAVAALATDAEPTAPAASNGDLARHSAGGLRRSAGHEYPKFFRRDDELVKVGWSKKERQEYNHRAPRRAIDAVAAAVRRIGAKGKRFNGDALLPLKDLTDGAAIPDYQAYVALAWLKHLGVVDQLGRKAGYTLVAGKQIDGTVTTAWPELTEWRG